MLFRAYTLKKEKKNFIGISLQIFFLCFRPSRSFAADSLPVIRVIYVSIPIRYLLTTSDHRNFGRKRLFLYLCRSRALLHAIIGFPNVARPLRFCTFYKSNYTIFFFKKQHRFNRFLSSFLPTTHSG